MRLALKIAYDGPRFSGSQVQAKGVRTVHSELVKALTRLGVPAEGLRWAGRTDAGVSAQGNVVVVESPLSPESLLAGLTFRMEDAWTWAWAEVGASFEPRHANRRRYRYHLRCDLDVQDLSRAMQPFVGTHDFTAFARPEPAQNPRRRVDDIRVRREGARLVIDVVGHSFLRNQVRRMVEAGRRVATGELPDGTIRDALENPRVLDFGVAPPEPLVLLDVEYDAFSFTRFAEMPRLFKHLHHRIGESETHLAVLHDLLP